MDNKKYSSTIIFSTLHWITLFPQIISLVEDELTKEQQDALISDMIIQSFKEGNPRFR